MAWCRDSYERPNQLARHLPRFLPLSMCSVVRIPDVRLTGNRVCSYLTHEVPRPSPRIPLDPDSRGTMHLLGRLYITRAHLGFCSANVEHDALVHPSIDHLPPPYPLKQYILRWETINIYLGNNLRNDRLNDITNIFNIIFK